MVEISIPYLKKLAVFFLATCITCVADSAKSEIIRYPQVNSVNLAQLPSLPPSPPPKSLKLGSKGENVKILQTQLKKLGYYQEEVNGRYGETTKVAVIAFQKSVNLKPDGITDANTWTKLQTTTPKQSNQKPKTKPPVVSNDKFLTKKRILWLGLGIVSVGAGLWLVMFIVKRSAYILNDDDLPPLPVNKSAENQTNIYNAVIQAPNNNSLNSHQNNGHIATEINTVPSVLSWQTSTELTSESKSESEPDHTPTPNKNPVSEHQTTLDILYLLELLSVLEQNVQIPANDISELASSNVPGLQKIDPVEELITSLASNQPSQRRKAIWELAQSGDSRAIQPLVNLMMQSDSQQTSLILEAISQISIRTLKPINRALISSFQHNNPDVRKNAIRDITRIYELIHQVYQILRNAVNDPDQDVQETAKWAINKLLPARRNKPPDNK